MADADCGQMAVNYAASVHIAQVQKPGPKYIYDNAHQQWDRQLGISMSGFIYPFII